MPLLSFENLDPNYLPFYDFNAINRGKILVREGRVRVTHFDGYSATCEVRDEQGHYQVAVTAESRSRVHTGCDCPQSTGGRSCKHIYASLIAIRSYIEKEAGHHWRYRLMSAIENTPKPKTTHHKRNKYLVLFGLREQKYAGDSLAYHLVPYRIRSEKWDRVSELGAIEEREAQNKLLDQDRSWVNAAESVYNPLDPRAVINLSLEGVQLYNMMTRMGSYYYGGTYGQSYYGNSDYASYLALLARLDAPVFYVTPQEKFKERVTLVTEPGKIEAALAKEGANYSLQAGLSLNGETFTTLKGNLHILAADPAWALAGRTILPIENPEAIEFMQYFPLQIPGQDEEEFRSNFLQPILERVPLKGDVVSWTDIQADPLPRLYLYEGEGKLRAELRFGYGENEVAADPKAAPLTIRDIPGSWGMLRIHRKPEQEDNFYRLLVDARYGLKRAASSGLPASHFELRARTHPLDFLLHSIPLLTQAGFEIFGEDNLKAARLNRNKPTISLNLTSGLDWFDLKAVAYYGDQEVSLRDIRRALLKQERFIKLADGSIGQIPEEWLERYRRLFALAEETEDGLRVQDFHLPLVDQMLADADQSQIPDDFKRRRELLQNFESIQPHPVPAGFAGTLRPYQKAGLDWLHFLHQYGFGGCLADDMGLGKTIQALAFFQSLKEAGQREAASLLVVPKSLIANWIREAERFTPGLRILEFMGNSRKKDTALFEDYDLILTTYGTMLRDIEFLRGYRFLYAALDESQNIKNPLAQSSKAARLLNARHRLVMTGTPVENNTFELWSQFAFLNPGLLGSLDYFKREFATPIQGPSKNDESLQTLRKLVFPFILRRTKDQVAPELPERTERILYTDFDPAQRKLYNQTRDYYRKQLLGLIEEEGLDDARMKILEGLLRLRQICIHPRLVQTTYHGESAKFELLLETLETLRAENHKALIFSQFVQSLHMLKTELEARQIGYAYLDGQTTRRQAQVDAFQSDPELPFFLISLKAGGVGLNLTAADYVIHLDPWWNPAVEIQAADRAHRIGQDKPVFIYKIIARDTVEEKILQLQEHKKELVNQIISAESSFFKSITKEDVKVLFS